VWIPVYAIYRDSDFYPESDVFDPTRFNEEAVKSRHSMVYLLFGNEPRNCITIKFKYHILFAFALYLTGKYFLLYDLCDFYFQVFVPYLSDQTWAYKNIT